MMADIDRSPEAQADLVSIGEDVAIRMQSIASAHRVLDAIEEKLKLLSDHPLIGEARPDLHPNVRCFPVGKYPYVIFYRPTANGIQVVRVLHGSRNIPEVFGRKLP